jgi:hypothetical protein
MKLHLIQLKDVNAIWEHAKPFIQSGLEESHVEEYDVNYIKKLLDAGKFLLIVAIDNDHKVKGAATFSLVGYPNKLIMFITSIGGTLISTQDNVDQLAAIARLFDANSIQGYCRKSVARLWERFNFKTDTTLVELTI